MFIPNGTTGVLAGICPGLYSAMEGSTLPGVTTWVHDRKVASVVTIPLDGVAVTSGQGNGVEGNVCAVTSAVTLPLGEPAGIPWILVGVVILK